MKVLKISKKTGKIQKIYKTINEFKNTKDSKPKSSKFVVETNKNVYCECDCEGNYPYNVGYYICCKCYKEAIPIYDKMCENCYHNTEYKKDIHGKYKEVKK